MAQSEDCQQPDNNVIFIIQHTDSETDVNSVQHAINSCNGVEMTDHCLPAQILMQEFSPLRQRSHVGKKDDLIHNERQSNP